MNRGKLAKFYQEEISRYLVACRKVAGLTLAQAASVSSLGQDQLIDYETNGKVPAKNLAHILQSYKVPEELFIAFIATLHERATVIKS